MTFNIYVRSYNRWDTITTGKIVEYCTYVVRKSQADKYKEAGVENVWGIEDELINSGEKVLNYLIENAPEDVICVLDDDLYYFRYRLDEYEKITDPVVATREIERLAQLVVDLDIGYGNVAGHSRLQYYDKPIKWVGVNGGVKIFNRKKVKGRFDSTYRFLSDDDFQFQELLYNRIVLLSMYFLNVSTIDVNGGGNNNDKTGKEFMSNHERLKEKWGKYYDLPDGSGSGKFKVKR